MRRTSLVAVLSFDGRNDEAIETATTVIRRSRELHLDDEAGRAYRIAGAGASEVFEYGPAERMLRDGITFAEQHELWNHRCYMTAHLGLVLWATGRWSEADEVAVAALREGRGGVTTRITALYVRGYVALGRGRLDEARDLLQRVAGARRSIRRHPARVAAAVGPRRDGPGRRPVRRRGRADRAGTGGLRGGR